MRVDRHSFHESLKDLSRIANSRAAQPALRAVLLDLIDGMLTISATDLSQRVAYTVPAKGENFTTCLPAKVLERLIKPDSRKTVDEVAIDGPNSDGTVSVLVDGMTSKIVASDPADFPAASVSAGDEAWTLAAVWPGKPCKDALGYVLPASSRDPSRPHLTTVFFDTDEMVATDGHRLHLAPLPTPLLRPFLISSTVANTLFRILRGGDDAIIVFRAEDKLRFLVGPWQVDTTVTDATFPPHRQVVPDHQRESTRVTLEVQPLTKAIARVDRVSKNNQAKLCINGVATLRSWDPDLGEAEIIVPTTKNNHEGDDLIVGVNSAYLKQAIATKDPTVDMSLAGPLDPIRIDLADQRLAVIMPVRL